MRNSTRILAIGLAFAATLAMAAEDAKNPLVKARIDTMRTIGANTKILGDMASGKTPYDAAAAEQAGGMLAGTVVTIADVFQPEESDPVSKAKPEIWVNWADFEGKADALFNASLALDTSSLEGLQAGMVGVGGACGACHKAYRN